MQVPLQITYRNIRKSEALDARVREKAAKLEEFHPNITRCRVIVAERHRHQRQGREFNVTIDARVPGHEVFIDRDHDEDVYVALRDAFDAAARKLEDLARQQRGDVKAHDVPIHGNVARLFAREGYGFIETPDGREYYFGRDNVVAAAFERLAVGDAVQFIEDLAGEGRQAKRVSAGKHG